MSYRVWKMYGLIFMVLIGAWSVLALSTKSPLGSPLNKVIAVLGFLMMLLISFLENRGEI